MATEADVLRLAAVFREKMAAWTAAIAAYQNAQVAVSLADRTAYEAKVEMDNARRNLLDVAVSAPDVAPPKPYGREFF